MADENEERRNLKEIFEELIELARRNGIFFAAVVTDIEDEDGAIRLLGTGFCVEHEACAAKGFKWAGKMLLEHADDLLDKKPSEVTH